MSERYPRIRVQAKNGFELVREGLSISFYMRQSHQQMVENVLRSWRCTSCRWAAGAGLVRG